MTTTKLKQPWQWRRFEDNEIESFLGKLDEPLIDLRGIKPSLRVTDGVIEGGQLLGGRIISGILPPTIVSPSMGSSDIARSPILTSSTFKGIRSNGEMDAHIASYWEISPNSDFSYILHASGRTITSTIAYDMGVVGVSLAANSTYYVRVSHEGVEGVISPWSPVSVFTTAPYAATVEQATLFNSGGHPSSGTGEIFSISADGNTVVAGVRTDSGWAYIGAVEVWTRSNGVWSHTTLPDISTASGYYHGQTVGSAISVNGNGTVIVVGAPHDQDAVDGVEEKNGAIYIYTRPNTASTTWTEVQVIKGPPYQNDDRYYRFGTAVTISDDGNNILASGGAYMGTLHYVRSSPGSSWMLAGPLPTPNGQLVARDNVKISGDGSTAVTVTPDNRIQVATYLNEVWTVDQILSTTDNANIGDNLNISTVGDVILATMNGAVYIFKLVNGTWVQDQKIENPQITYNGASLSGDGTTIAISGDVIYKYVDDNGLWVDAGVILSNDPEITSAYGNYIDMSEDGSTIAVGDKGSRNSLGGIYIYS